MKTITELELAGQPPAERAITDQLIRQGRIKVVAVKEKEKRPPKPPRMPEPLESLVGRRVKLTLTNGDDLEGILHTVSRFEVVLILEDECEIVVLKHAIMTAQGGIDAPARAAR
jgi:small nuclear ribonucleoprotein (snRNP)-like protein